MKKYVTIMLCLILINSEMSCKKHHSIPQVPAPEWEVDNTGKYPVSMTAVVQVPENIRPYIQQGDKIGAFVGEECRGVGQLVRTGSVSAFFLLIHGTASEQSKISFKYWNSWKSYLYSSTAFLDFMVDGNYGTADAPEVLQLNPVRQK